MNNMQQSWIQLNYAKQICNINNYPHSQSHPNHLGESHSVPKNLIGCDPFPVDTSSQSSHQNLD
jgi:hypothetical protein